MRTSSLLVLDPPYASVRRLGEVPPALGAVALIDATAERPTTNELKAEMELVPWCPVCLLADPDSGMRGTRRLLRACVVFGLGDEGNSAILRSVANRPRPTPSAVVEWIVRRAKVPTLSRTLAELFTRPALRSNELSFLPHAMREQIRLLGDWSAVDWQRAAQLAELAADRTLLLRTLESSDTDAVERRRWIAELLGVSDREFHERFGWEWVFEASLRRSGFFERDGRGGRSTFPRTAVVLPGLVGSLGGNPVIPRRATA